MYKFDKLPLTKIEIDELINKYYGADGHVWPEWMSYANSENEVRYDYDGSKICYSLVREFKPTNVLEFGTSFGHSTVFITDALLKNELPFKYIAFEMERDLWVKTSDNLARRHGVVLPLLVNRNIMECAADIPDNLDFVFIDSNHEQASTDWYIEHIFPKIVPGGLVAIHDFAVTEDENGEWRGKGADGSGGLAETQILMDLQKEGKLPLEKIYWMYPDSEAWGHAWEGSFWIKK